MGTTSNFNLFYPEPDDAVSSYPSSQRTSQETIDTLLKQLKDMTDGATANNIANALVRRSPSGSANFASLWVAGVPANTGSVVNKGYADAGDSSTLNAAKSHADTGDAATLAAAKSHADGRTPPITVDTSVGTRIMVGDTMVFGDTGWRDVTALIAPGWTVETVQIKRETNTVKVRFVNMTAGPTGSLLLNLPVGWRRSGMSTLLPLATNLSGGFSTAMAYATSLHLSTNTVTFTNHWAYFTYECTQVWPSSLFGTPA